MSRNIKAAACTGICLCAYPFPIGESLKVIGGKWKLRIICTFYVDGKLRYNDLLRKTCGVTNAMMSVSLKELETDGIIIRRQYEEIPPRIEYSLTERGSALWPSLHQLAHWAAGKSMAEAINKNTKGVF